MASPLDRGDQSNKPETADLTNGTRGRHIVCMQTRESISRFCKIKYNFCYCNGYLCSRDKWVPVTTAWGFVSMWMAKRAPIFRVGANIINKQLRTADKGWSRGLGVG